MAVCVSVLNFIIGALYGAVEGYYGGVLDIVLERISDILNGVPFIVVATLFQIHLSAKVGAVPCLLFAFVLTGWLGTAYRVRTQFYRFKNQEYVMAARTLGAKGLPGSSGSTFSPTPWAPSSPPAPWSSPAWSSPRVC